MITAIKIDLTELFNEFSSMSKIDGDEMASNIVKHIARRFYESWSATAQQELKSSRKEYVNSLQIINEDKTTTAIILRGKLPNMIESGCSAFDMKEGFSKSLKKKITKDGGWYLTVPFRFAGAGSLGEDSGFAGVMPQEIYEEVKNFKASKTQDVLVDGEIKSNNVWGDRLNMSKFDLADKYKADVRPAYTSLTNESINEKSEVEYKHKSSIYEGMIKSSKQYEKANQSMYNTFRRVSSNSDKNSWINQGITAYNLAEKAMSGFDIERERDVAIDNELSRLGL